MYHEQVFLFLKKKNLTKRKNFAILTAKKHFEVKMNVPKSLHYTNEHEWAKIEAEVAVIGITDFAQHELTDIVFVELPDVGKNATQFKAVAVVESVKSVSDVFAPVSGEIVAVNEELKEHPELVNQDPYGKGWIAKIRLSNKEEIKNLLSSHQYEELIKKENH